MLRMFLASVEAVDRMVHEKMEDANPITRFDTMLFSVAMPLTLDSAEVFILREMMGRLATLGIGIRLYEKQCGVLPDRLEQLTEIGLDVSKLTPLGDKPFGYRKEQARAILWGFHVGEQQSTPAEPPIVESSHGEAGMDAKADLNRTWVWEFLRVH